MTMRSLAYLGAVVALSVTLPLVGCAGLSPEAKAMSLVRQGKESEAIATLREATTRNPNDIGSRRLLVRVLAQTGDMGAARAEIAELEKRLPAGDPTPYLELGHAYELTHAYDEALAAYDEAAKVAPTSPAGPREGGMRAARWGEAEEARPRLEEAKRRGADDAEMLHALGLVRLQTGDPRGAIAAYRLSAERAPASIEGWMGMATAALRMDDAQAALVAYEQILARRPAFASAALGRAWCLLLLARYDEAERALAHAEELGAPKAYVAKQREELSRRRTASPPAREMR